MSPFHLRDHPQKCLDVSNSIGSHGIEASVEGYRLPSTRNAHDSCEGYRIYGELSEGQLECVSALGPALHESMQSLVVGAPFLAGKSENEIREASVPDPVLDDFWKAVVP